MTENARCNDGPAGVASAPAQSTTPIEAEIAEILFPAAAIARRVQELGAAIDRDFAGQEPVLVTVLQGALVFAADLMRSIHHHVQLASVLVSSYPAGTRRAKQPRILADVQIDIAGRHVILVEDIVDSGYTVRALLDRLERRAPASLSVAAFLDKPSGRETAVPLRYTGFEAPPVFVVGYGLDHSGRFRNLPDIGIPRKTVRAPR